MWLPTIRNIAGLISDELKYSEKLRRTIEYVDRRAIQNAPIVINQQVLAYAIELLRQHDQGIIDINEIAKKRG